MTCEDKAGSPTIAGTDCSYIHGHTELCSKQTVHVF